MTDPKRRAEEVARKATADTGFYAELVTDLASLLPAFGRAVVERNLAELEDWLAANCAPWNHPSLSVTGLYSAVLNEIARRRASLKV